MDGDTERALAALLLREAAQLKRQAEEEGVGAYLRPKVRYRPNSHFLRATVRSVEHANRISEMSEMWKRRETESQDVDDNPECEPSSSNDPIRGKNTSRNQTSSLSETGKRKDFAFSRHGTTSTSAAHPSTSSARRSRDENSNEGNSLHNFKRAKLDGNESEREQKTFHKPGTRWHAKDTIDPHDEISTQDRNSMEDTEMERFLASRVKRGRGMIGARMDLAGPYPLPSANDECGMKGISGENMKWKMDKLEKISSPDMEVNAPPLPATSDPTHSSSDYSKTKLRSKKKKKRKEEKLDKRSKRSKKSSDSSDKQSKRKRKKKSSEKKSKHG